MNKSGILLCLLIFVGLSCVKERVDKLDERLETVIARASKSGSMKEFLLPSSTDFTSIPQEPKNPLSKAKVALGQMLFFETGLAQNPRLASNAGTYSCASCHVPSAGFRPGRIQGIGDGGVGTGFKGAGRRQYLSYPAEELDVQEVRALSVLNVAYVAKNTLWSGQFGAGYKNEGTEHAWTEENGAEVNFEGLQGLETQNIEGMDLHRLVVNKALMDELGYTPMFDAAFGDVPVEERYNKHTASFALSAYLRTLLTNEAPFQAWLRGDKSAMDRQTKEGAILFFSEAACANCHQGPGLSAVEFYALGVKDLHEHEDAHIFADKRNLGRGGFTENPEDLYKFKVPQLYNLQDSPFYFHGSSKTTLAEVVDYFNAGVSENPNVPNDKLSPAFRPLHLSDEEKASLLRFLEIGLRDPNLQRYVPESVLSGNCFPNNDALSKIELGCE